MNTRASTWIGLFLFLFSCQVCFAQNKSGIKDQAAEIKNAVPSATDTGFLYHLQRRPDSLYFNNVVELEKQLSQLSFVSGTVYFSGAGFTSGTVSAYITGSLVGLRSQLEKCGPGSRITLEKCVLLKSNNARTIPLNKSLFIIADY